MTDTLFDGITPQKRAKVPNPCYGAEFHAALVPTTHYGVRHMFTPSTVQLGTYAASQKHKVPQHDGNDTFDDEAVRTLRLRYPKDPLYPRLEGFRILQKALGTYIAKLSPLDRDGKPNKLFREDGRLHDPFRHTPKTLRLAMELLQVLPRPTQKLSGPDDPKAVYNAIRQCFVPAEGHSFVAADFAGIEPLLVAYFAKDSQFLRACRTSAHSWFASNVIGKPPDFDWSDADIAAYYKGLAKGGPYLLNGERLPWDTIRNSCKVAAMLSLYAGGSREMVRNAPEVFKTVADAAYCQDAFFDLCPKVKQWHWNQAEEAETKGYLTTPIGFRLHYSNLFQWKDGVRSLSRTAKEAIASVPQHTGAMYLFTAAIALAEESPLIADGLRLLIHDEIFTEVPTPRTEEAAATLKAVMERPHPLMPLDWCSDAERAILGSHLAVKVETKRSDVSWGEMK